jgi:hypothetical protein
MNVQQVLAAFALVSPEGGGTLGTDSEDTSSAGTAHA